MKLEELKINDIIILKHFQTEYYIVVDICLRKGHPVKTIDLSASNIKEHFCYFTHDFIKYLEKVDLPISDYA